ncbi:MAG TPA: SDR family oxidoreductase [Candidatus Lokiarchaeia archaeon]|nr:SDR family oxidoreductase [Candidatus Lokiarchaeia archaeon]
MKVLVTGSEGYIGSVLCPLLESKGYEVTRWDTGFFKDCILNGMPVADSFILKDMREVSSNEVKDIDAIIYLAALSNDPMGELNPAITDEINFQASINLAKLAKDAGVERFVFSSSCSVYGAAGSKKITEKSELSPVTEYARSKIKMEEALHELASDDFHPVMMRNATVFGLSPRIRFDLVVNQFTGYATITKHIKMLSDGTPWRPNVHVQDVSAAFIAALEAPVEKIHDQIFNVGMDSENYPIRKIADIVIDVVPGSELECLNQTPNDPRSYNVSFQKIKKNLPEFQPRWTVKAGVEEMFAAIEAATLSEDDMLSKQYVRLKQLKFLIENNMIDDQLRWIL